MRLLTRILLALLAASAAWMGIWALVAPRSFFTDFPGLGWRWVVVDGPYNEHLIRDVGGLSLGLAVVNAVAAWRLTPALVATAAGAGLCVYLPHLLYHLGHREELPAAQRLAEALALTAPVASAIVLLVLATRLPGPDTVPDR
jgi:hypothetical protein